MNQWLLNTSIGEAEVIYNNFWSFCSSQTQWLESEQTCHSGVIWDRKDLAPAFVALHMARSRLMLVLSSALVRI